MAALWIFFVFLFSGACLSFGHAIQAADSKDETPGTSDAGDADIRARIGIIQLIEHPALDAAREGFIDGLAAHGYRENDTMTLYYANAQGDQATSQTIANQFASYKLDLILAIATPAAQAIANVIKDVPVLVTAVTDPAESGLVAQNDAPGGNISGTSDMSPVEDQIKLLHTLLPDARRIAIMYASSETNSKIQADLAEDALTALGLDAEIKTASSSNELQQVVESAVGQADAVYIPTDNMFANAMALVKQVTEQAKLPVVVGEENMLKQGALATVSLDYHALGEQTAEMARRILEEGADPATMPIEYQQDPRPMVNMDNARAVGVAVPEDLEVERYSAVGDLSSPEPSTDDGGTSLGDADSVRQVGFRQAFVSAITQGLAWSVMALGIYITFRLLKISDLTVDGSFTTGGAVTAVALSAGIPPLPAVLLALPAGMLAGAVTGFLTTRMRIPALLSSILTQIALYSINLRIMGSPNIPLLNIATLFTARSASVSQQILSLLISAAFVAIIVVMMYGFFGTEIGAAIRATGSNPAMVRALGTNTQNTVLLGLILANGLVAFSGGLVAQQQGYADIGMGTGAIVIGLAAIVIGEALFFRHNFWFRLGGVIVGSVLYRIIITFILRWDPIQASDLKLFTAILVALALFLPEALGRSRRALTQRRRHHA